MLLTEKGDFEVEEDALPVEISEKLSLVKRHKVLLIISGVMVILFGIFALTLVIYTWDRGVITNGVVLSGIPLGQLHIEDAQIKLEENKKKHSDRPVHFTTAEKTISISMGELGLTYTYDEVLQQAYLIGREGFIVKKALDKFKASWGISLDVPDQWNDVSLRNALDKHMAPLNIPAENAHFIINQANTMEIVPEKLGKQVDIDSLITSIRKLPKQHSEAIPIPLNDVSPSVTKTELENLKTADLLSSYTTSFNPNQWGRTENIKLAAKAIDCTVLKPAEEFSFNQTVGPRTVEAGYQMAIIIEGNQFVPGLGGGVCQVSSTLYNAVQQAKLTVSERSQHSIAITYVPTGQDATVAYPNLDFKFKNNTGGYILIRSNVTGGTLTFSLYGKHNN